MKKTLTLFILLFSFNAIAQNAGSGWKTMVANLKMNATTLDGLSMVRKVHLYNKEVLVDVNIPYLQGIAKKVCPNLMYDINFKDSLHYDRQNLRMVMTKLTEEEGKLSANEKKKILVKISKGTTDKYLASGFFLIGQYAYQDGDYPRAVRAFKASCDLFAGLETNGLIMAKVNLAVMLAQFKVNGDTELEQLIWSDNGLYGVSQVKGSQFIRYLATQKDNPCAKKPPTESSIGQLIAIHNIFWKYGNYPLIRLDQSFRTPHQKGTLPYFLNEKTQEITLPFQLEGLDGSSPASAEQKKLARVQLRFLKDPFVSTVIFNGMIGANDLLENYTEDSQLLRKHLVLSDYILSKNDLAHQLSTSTATWEELAYDPTNPEKLEKELREAIKKSEVGVAQSLLYRHLATLFYTQNQLDSAANHLEMVYRIERELFPQMKPPQANLVHGFFSYLKGDYEKAKTLCQAALDQQGEGHPAIGYTFHVLGLIHRAEQNTEEAISCFEWAVSIFEEQTQKLRREINKEYFMQRTYDAYENLIALYKQEGRTEDAFIVTMKSQNKVFRQTKARNEFLTGKYRDEIEQITNLSTEKEVDQEALQILIDFYSLFWQSEKDYEYLRVDQKAEAEPLFSIQNMRSKLAKDEVLLSYYITDDQFDCYILSHDTIQVVTLASEKEVRQAMLTFQEKFIKTGKEGSGYTLERPFFEVLRPIYKQIWAAVEATGTTKGKKLVIKPYGPLNYFPFEMLFDDDAPKDLAELNYLVKRHDIRYLPELSFAPATKKKTYSKDFLGFGNPVFQNTLDADRLKYDSHGRFRSNLTPLGHTKEEIESIAAKFPSSSTVFLGKDATEENLKQLSSTRELANYRYIHIATHGIINHKNPLLSAIALTQDKNPEEDGFLQFYEIDRENIRIEAELLVLSACETGLGKMNRSEGVIGFSKAFTKAGAQAVVLSKWPVYDKKTADFFKAYYSLLAQNPKRDKAEALAEVKRNFIEKGVKPYHWASFVYYGG